MRTRFAAVFVLLAALAACDSALDPDPWNDTPVEISLHSASAPEPLNLVSALDVVALAAVRLEQAGAVGNFDVILGTMGAQLVLIPAGALEGAASRAGIATITGQSFESLLKAPSDTAAYSSQPVPLQAGGVYVVRSRRFTCGYSAAVNYAKLEAVAVDAAAGTATLAVVRNPYCNDRSFVPPED